MSKDYNHKECMLALARALRNIAAGLEKYPEQCIGERDGGVSMKDISVRVPHQRDKYGDVDYAKVSCSYTMDDDCAALRDEPMYRTVKHHTDESSPNLFRDKVFSMLWVYFMQEFPEAVWEADFPLQDPIKTIHYKLGIVDEQGRRKEEDEGDEHKAFRDVHDSIPDIQDVIDDTERKLKPPKDTEDSPVPDSWIEGAKLTKEDES